LWQVLRASPGNPRLDLLMRVGVGAVMVVAPIVLLAFIASAIVYVRLTHGPVSLKAFCARIEQGIGAGLGPFRAQIDDAVVALVEGRGLELQLINLRVSEQDGDLVASAPLAAVELDHAALLLLRAVPQRVFLIEPRLSLLYTDEGGLALSFADPGPVESLADVRVPVPVPAKRAPAANAGGGAAVSERAETVREKTPPMPAHKIDLARALVEGSARARSGALAASSLREIGLRDATLVVDYRGSTSEWKVAEAAVDLEHKSRGSVISGGARIDSPRGPWALSFRTEDSERGSSVRMTMSVRDLVPRTLAQAAPPLSLLETLDMPIAGDLALDLSGSGEIREAKLDLELGRGRIDLPDVGSAPLTVDAGKFHLTYDAAAQSLKVAPSTLAWGDSHMSIEGAMTRGAGPAGMPEWHFALKANEGVLAAEEFGVEGIKVDAWAASGRLVPHEGRVELSDFTLEAGGATVAIKGEVIAGGGAPSTRIEATMSPMSLPTLKTLWPRAVAPGARMWVGKHVTGGNLRSGTLKLVSGSYLGSDDGAVGRERLSMTIEAGDLKMVPLPDGLPIEAPRALIRLENNVLEVTIPDAAIVAAGARQVPLKAGRFTVVDVQTHAPVGELAFQTQTSLSALLEAARRSQHVPLPLGSLPAEAIDGKVDGQFKVTMSLAAHAGAAKAEGKARISDIKAKQPLGAIEVQGGTIDVDLSETGVMAVGEMLVNGVLAKLDVQRIFDAPPEMQPPMRLTATLDNADRTQLGLDINHIVQGEVPFEITVAQAQATGGPPAVHARADLTNAELALHDLAWRKPPGRAAFLEFDVASGRSAGMELTNFKVVGDDVAIEGSLVLDDTNEVSEYTFPNFSLNVVSRLEVSAKLGANKVWAVKARGSVYDGRDLFRSLLALGQSSDAEVKPRRPSEGMDLEAEIDTVLGHSDVSMRGFKLKLSERKDLLTALDAQGTLDGGKPLVVVLKKDSGGPRTVYADSTDAGQAFKLVGFYPNIQGGRVRLEVNLDGRGAAEKNGVLWVDSFRVLGDAVVSEVYSSVATGGPAIDGTPQGQRRVVREVFEFDRMKVPFSVGHGQFVLEESYVKGPVMGASIRGKVDYNAQRVNLGGTYVPLQGISTVFCEIPLFGPIVAGPGCEGIFGITYAIQGPMARPQVVVNPLSMLTPGIFRGIMEMTNPNPKVQPREEVPMAPAERRVRASSSSVSAGEPAKGGNVDPARAGTIDGWSSETPGAGAKSKN
jgi:hypothetical protein